MPRRKAAGTFLLLLVVGIGLAPASRPAELLGPSAVGFAVGPSPLDLAVADFDRDGALDLAVVNNRGPGSLSILRGDGRGGFAAAEDVAVETRPTSVAVADFDGDGRVDLAVANQGSASVSLLLGQAGGTFAPATRFPGSYLAPTDLATADFNRDGSADLAVVDPADGSVGILLGRGDGQFDGPSFVAGLSFPLAIAVGDFNADTAPDFVVTHPQQGSVSVVLGVGDGTFSAPDTGVGALPGSFPVAVVVGHFDADAAEDLAVLNGDLASVSLLLGNGNGTFGLPNEIDVGRFPMAASVGDLDGDGAQDLVVANHDDDSLSTLLGDGLGGFVRPCRGRNLCEDDVTPCSIAADCAGIGAGTCNPTCSEVTASSPTALAVADFDRDGAPDLVVANENGDTVRMLRGDGLGGLVEASGVRVGRAPQAVATGDFNSDGVSDLAVANAGSDSVEIRLNDLIGGFVAAADPSATFDNPVSVAVSDFDRDGHDDLAVVNLDGTDNNVSVLLGLGDPQGGFAPSLDIDLARNKACSVAVGDFDGDGNPDLAVVHALIAVLPNNVVSILLGQGDGSFVPHASLTVRDDCGFAGVDDFDNDGNLDLAVTNIRTDSVRVFLGRGDGSFATQTPDIIDVGVRPASIAVGDFNGDDAPDLAVPLFSGAGVSILIGRGDGFFDHRIPDVPVGENPQSITVADLNADGAPDLVVTNAANDSVSTLLGLGGGSFVRGPDVAVGAEPVGIAIGDFNADEHPDAVVANRLDDSVSVLLNQLVDRGDGNGSNRIDGFDLAAIGRLAALGAGDPGYVRNVDVDLSGMIDGNDLARAASSFGELVRASSPLRAVLVNPSPPAADTVTFRQEASAGDLLTVQVVIDTLLSSAAADFAVTFEPADNDPSQVLEVAGFDPGTHLAGRVGQFYALDESVPGRVGVTAARLPNEERPGTGEQVLMSLLLRARRDGTAALGFDAFRRATPTLVDGSDMDVAGVGFVGTASVDVVASGGGPPGQRIGTSPDLLDFGNVAPGDSLSRQLRISNFGFSELGISNITSTLPEITTFFGSGCDDPQTGVSCFTIPPFGFVELTVVFSPLAAGTVSGELVIQSDDPDRPELRAAVLGAGAVP